MDIADQVQRLGMVLVVDAAFFDESQRDIQRLGVTPAVFRETEISC